MYESDENTTMYIGYAKEMKIKNKNKGRITQSHATP